MTCDCTSFAAFGAWTVSGTRTIDARLGFSVAIPCTPPMANPAPIVFWQANDTNLPAGDPLSGGAADRVQVLPSGHLVIHALVAADFTPQYRCSVSNARTHTTSQSPQTFTLNQGTVYRVYTCPCIVCNVFPLCTKELAIIVSQKCFIV